MLLFLIGCIFVAMAYFVPKFNLFKLIAGFEDLNLTSQHNLESSSFPKLFRSTFLTIGFLIMFTSFFEEDLKAIHILLNLLIGIVTLPSLALVIETVIILKFKAKK